PFFGVDRDDIALPQEPDRTTLRRFGAHMTDAETARCAREPPVGDQCDLIGKTLPVQCRRRRQHLAHAWPAFRSLITDDDDVSRPIVPRLNSRKGILFAIEDARRSAVVQMLEPCHLHDGALWSKIAL